MELLEAVRGGDTTAFGTLYRRHWGAARSLARQVVQSEDAVEDLLVETFARILDVVRRGGGPACAFRPYLLASVRRYAAAGVVDLADGDSLYVDPELTGLERSPLARAYRSLPERWRAVLWHVEIEGGRPADTGPLVGLSGRAVALLTRRARQGLREAYLRLHLENGPRAECRPILSMILRYVENGLPKQEAGAVDAHVAECIDCRSVFLQLVDLTQELRAVVGQLVAGPAVDEYLADLAAVTATGSRPYGGGRTSGTSGHGPNGRAGGRAGGRVGSRARARLEAVRHHMGALTSRADRRMRGAVRTARGGTGPAGRARGRADALLRGALGRARTTTRRACATVSAAPGAMYGRVRVMTRRVFAKVGPKAGGVPRVAFARARAALARLSALVRGVPTPHRAVLGGIAVAALATAAFLLVAQPTGMLFTGSSGGQDGTRALDRPQPADSAASRSRAATGQAGSAGTPSPYDPRRPSAQESRTAVSTPTPETADDPAAVNGADGPSAGIALGMPEISGGVTPGADRQPPREEPTARDATGRGATAREDTAREDTARGEPAQGAAGSLSGRGRAGEDHRSPRRDDGRSAASGVRGPAGGQHAGAGRETGRLTGRGQDGGGQAGGRVVSEPDTTTVLAGRDQDSRHADASRASAPERQQVRGRLSRHPYQEHRAQASAQSGAQSSAQTRVQGSAQGSGQGRAQSSARARAQAGARPQAPERARERTESQAGRPATDRAPLVRPGTAQGRPQAGERGREAREHARSDRSDTGAQKAAGGGRKAKEALVAAVDPLGALLRGQSGLVAVRLRNAGDAATGEVTATVTLPPGVRYLGQDGRGGRSRAAGGGTRQGHEAKPGIVGQDGAIREDRKASDGAGQGRAADGRTERARTGNGAGDGWSCEALGRVASGQVVRCVRGPLAAGEVTAIFLKVAVAADAPTGRAFTVRVRSGRLETIAESTVGVRASGAAARFAADGRLLARVVGNTLVSSAAPAAPCGAAGGGRDRDSGVSVPIDLDRDPSTRTSSCADLDLPAGDQVLWAGLYWSGGGRGAVPAEDIRVRAPGMPGYATLHAAEVARRNLPTGSGYQAFADVTSLVRSAGGGRWWVAGVPARTGTVRHAAWGLVVMAEDARQPYTRAVVLDAAAVIGSEEKSLRLPLDGLAPGGAPARIDLMVWNGEGVRAGVVTMGDRARGDREDRSREGVLDQGDAGGVAVDTLHALLGPHPALQLATRRDPVFFGVAVVSARTWS
ncbi:sigma factor [Microbispora sp. KK1-11]|uniref:sigma factor n=1 Tax=Microbispora sp. KK1-11 TaxID=2053005 RepID=UPI00163B792E|nr:sigma factor [Microbispora sp. KK1-11]